MPIISAPRLLVDGSLSGPGAVVVDGGTLSRTSTMVPSDGTDHVRLPHGVLSPGLVDIQRLVPVSLLVFALLVGLGTLLIAADIFNPVHLQV